MKNLLQVAVVLAGLAHAAPAFAQIVNVQSLIGSDQREGWSGGLDASADWRTGNVKLLLLSAAGTARWHCGPNLAFLIVKGDYGRAGQPSSLFLERTFEHARYRRQLLPWLVGEAFAQDEADRFKRLTLRMLAGAGPRFVLVERPAVGVAIGVAYMFEYQQLADDTQPDAGSKIREHRISSYLAAHVAQNAHVQVIETFYVQPRIDAPSDLRLLNELGVVSKLSDHLSFKTAFVLAYDARPPDGIEHLDTTVQTGISVGF